MQKMGFNLIAAAVLAAASVSAHADFLGVYAGLDGAFVKSETDSSSSNEDTKFAGTYSLAFEHPVPFVPNAKIRYSKYETSDWEDFGPAVVNAKQQFDSLDMIAYYEILDNVVSVDAGAGAKKITSEVNLTGTSKFTGGQVSFVDNYDDTLPGLYVAAGGKLPLTGLSAKAEVFAGRNSDADFVDYNAELKYDFFTSLVVNLGAKVGYRNLKVTVDDDNQAIDKLTAKGPYIGLEAHF